MATIAGINNTALQLIKNSKTIVSLGDGTKESNACNVIYAELRDNLLAMHNWNFATKRLKLPRLTNAPAFEWTYGYQLPSDFIRVSMLSDNSSGTGTVAYKIEGDQVNTDAADLYLKYVYQVTDPNLMIPSFRLALSKFISSYLAVALAQSASRSVELRKEFFRTDLPLARSIDAMQDPADSLPESSWVTSRGG